MSSKECFKCGAEKPLSEFYKHARMKDGYVNKCKECNKKDNRQNRVVNRDYYREFDRGRANLPHRVKQREDYNKTERGKEIARKSRTNYLEKNPKKRKVHILTGNAIRSGKLVKGVCEVCGDSNVHAHHDDYDLPMAVRWLCAKHHAVWHKQNGEGLNPK